MKWVTWRQHRTEAIVSAALLVPVVIFLLVTGIELRNVSLLGKASVEYFASTFPFIAIQLLPFVLGIFAGAPMVAQELERGTYRLAWTQGITRERWFLTKLAFTAGATLLIILVVTGVLLWWNQPINETLGAWATFDSNGFVILAHALFALTLGIALGTVLGKSVGAMALFVPVFPAVRAFFFWLRAYYLPPVSLRWDYKGGNPLDGLGKIWVVGQNFLDRLGKPISSDLVYFTCGPQNILAYATDPELFACFRENGFSIIARYQPLERFWLFQGIESLIFIALAAGLVGLTVWWLKKKIS